jgi:hypothetical protein
MTIGKEVPRPLMPITGCDVWENVASTQFKLADTRPRGLTNVRLMREAAAGLPNAQIN